MLALGCEDVVGGEVVVACGLVTDVHAAHVVHAAAAHVAVIHPAVVHVPVVHVAVVHLLAAVVRGRVEERNAPAEAACSCGDANSCKCAG